MRAGPAIADGDQVLEDEVLPGTESADQPAKEMSDRRDHGRKHIGKVRIELFAKLFILQVYDVLARHMTKFIALSRCWNAPKRYVMGSFGSKAHRNLVSFGNHPVLCKPEIPELKGKELE